MKYKLSLFNIPLKEISAGTYYYNTLSKAILLLSNDILDKLAKGKLCEIDDITQDELFRNGFLIREEQDELQILQVAYKNAHSQSNFYNLILIPTFACNFSCPYCFEGEKPAFNIQEIQNYFYVLREFSKKEFALKKHIHFSLFGGEPLLAYDQFKDYFLFLSELSKDYGFQYSCNLTTNGYLLSEKIYQELFSLFHLESIQITLDGNEKSHNTTRVFANNSGIKTFSHIILNLKKLIHYIEENEEKCDVKLRINLINNTLEDIKQVLVLFNANEKKKFTVYFRPIYNTKFYKIANDNRNNLKDFYSLAHKLGFHFTFGESVNFCHCEGDGGLDQFCITPDCCIWKCINDFSEGRAKIGHISQDGSLLIEKDKLLHWMKNNPFECPTCKSCKWLPVCWGGCPLQYSKNQKHICMYEKKYDLLDIILAKYLSSYE